MAKFKPLDTTKKILVTGAAGFIVHPYYVEAAGLNVIKLFNNTSQVSDTVGVCIVK